MVTINEEASAISMTYPPSQSIESTTKKKSRGPTTHLSISNRSKSASGSNDPEFLALQYNGESEEVAAATKVRRKRGVAAIKMTGEKRAAAKAKGKKCAADATKEKAKEGVLDSPAMRTRSKLKVGEPS